MYSRTYNKKDLVHLHSWPISVICLRDKQKNVWHFIWIQQCEVMQSELPVIYSVLVIPQQDEKGWQLKLSNTNGKISHSFNIVFSQKSPLSKGAVNPPPLEVLKLRNSVSPNTPSISAAVFSPYAGITGWIVCLVTEAATWKCIQ